jgi:hypothetical protein
MGRLKLRMLVPEGGVSKIVMVTLALPLVQVVQVLFMPLQDDNDKAAIAATRVTAHFHFIEHPVD